MGGQLKKLGPPYPQMMKNKKFIYKHVNQDLGTPMADLVQNANSHSRINTPNNKKMKNSNQGVFKKYDTVVINGVATTMATYGPISSPDSQVNRKKQKQYSQHFLESFNTNNIDFIKKMWKPTIMATNETNNSNIIIPIIEVIIQGQPIQALFDTGADTCVMSQKTAVDLNIKTTPSSQMVNSCVLTALKVIGQATLNIQFGCRNGLQKFIIVEKLNHPIILGMDLIMRWGIIPILHSGEYCFQNDQGTYYKFLDKTKMKPDSPVTVSAIGAINEPQKYSKRVLEIFSELCNRTQRMWLF